MIKIKKNKTGELTTTQLVTIIILIVSFIIILFLIFRLNPGEQSNKEICHNSVILKAKSAGLAGSLDCRINYVCISGGDSCANENPTSKVEIDLDSKNSKKEIMESVANEMADCWYMFGEGKVGYDDKDTLKTQCSICSIVEFDAKTQEKFPAITYTEFYDYLRTTKKSGSQSYLNYLYGVDSLDSLKIQKQFPAVKIADDTIQTDRKYSIITGIVNNIGVNNIGDDEYLKVYIIPTAETSATACNDYLTKP